MFICSRNQWRSPTAEAIWRRREGCGARSAGTSPKAKRTVSAADINWADIIFVMEGKHRDRLKARFSRPLAHKSLHVLDIPDEYHYMDEELIALLEESVSAILQQAEGAANSLSRSTRL